MKQQVAVTPKNSKKVKTWLEEKALIKRLFSEMTSREMFCEFDSQLQIDENWRAKIVSVSYFLLNFSYFINCFTIHKHEKSIGSILGSQNYWISLIHFQTKYLLEKVNPADFKETIRSTLKAAMPLQIQALYSHKGQKKKHRFDRTSLFTIIKGMIE